MNIAKLLQVKKEIFAAPEYFQLDAFFSDGNVGCEIRGCIATWAVALEMGCTLKEAWIAVGCSPAMIMTRAGQILELSVDEQCVLFLVRNWPNRFYWGCAQVNQDGETAQLAADFIDWFIAKNSI